MANSQESSANAAALVAQGIPQSFIDSQLALGKGGPANGSFIDTQDMAGFTSAYNTFQNSPQNQMNNLSGQMANLTSQQYQFDAADYLPKITETANSIYSPQQAQLEAIRQLQNASAADTKVQTEKDFAKRMQQETEAINRRGSFFSGGAIQNEQDIRSQESSQLFQQGLQASAADFSNLGQQAAMQAEKNQFITDKLTGAENSAYSRWTDQRNFSFQALQTQYTNMVNERNYTRSVFESDRSYNESVREFNKSYSLSVESSKLARDQYNQTVKASDAQIALAQFKATSALTNSGDLGVNSFNQDTLDSYAQSYASNGGEVNTSSSYDIKPINANDSFNIDNFILGK